MTYIFDHIFKTGGTTFNLSYLLGAFPCDQAIIISGLRDTNREDLERLMALSDEEKRQIKVIAGHNTGSLRPYYPDARFITIVRDPIERAISAYLHARHHPDAWAFVGHALAVNGIGLAEFVRDDFFAREYADFVSIHNWQAKVLLGQSFESGLDEKAISGIIHSRYFAIGYTEQLELFLFYLHITAGFPLLLFNNRLVRKERASFKPSLEDIASIVRFNQLDMCVYRCVKHEFDEMIKRVWNQKRELLYQQYVAALNAFRRESTGVETVVTQWFIPNKVVSPHNQGAS